MTADGFTSPSRKLFRRASTGGYPDSPPPPRLVSSYGDAASAPLLSLSLDYFKFTSTYPELHGDEAFEVLEQACRGCFPAEPKPALLQAVQEAVGPALWSRELCRGWQKALLGVDQQYNIEQSTLRVSKSITKACLALKSTDAPSTFLKGLDSEALRSALGKLASAKEMCSAAAALLERCLGDTAGEQSIGMLEGELCAVGRWAVVLGIDPVNLRPIAEAFFLVLQGGADWSDGELDAWEILLRELLPVVAWRSSGEFLGKNQIKLIQHTWRTLQHAGPIILRWFHTKLFQLDSSAQDLFKNADVEAVSTRLAQMMDRCVILLEDQPTLLAMLRDVGRRHGHYGVAYSHYLSGGVALMHTLRTSMPSALWTAEARESWQAFWDLIAGTMYSASISPLLHKHGPDLLDTWDKALLKQKSLSARVEEFLELSHPATLKKLQRNKATLGPCFGFLRLFAALFEMFRSATPADNILDVKMQQICRLHMSLLRAKGVQFGDASAALRTLSDCLRAAMKEEWSQGKSHAWDWFIQTVLFSTCSRQERRAEETAVKLQAVKRSWEMITPIRDRVSKAMYRHILADPTIERLFKDRDMSEQGEKFMKMMEAIVNRLDEQSVVAPLLEQLGVIHKGLNVVAHMYDTFEVAFCEAMKEGLGMLFWTEHTLSSWRWVFSLINTHMRPGKLTWQDGEDSYKAAIHSLSTEVGLSEGLKKHAVSPRFPSSPSSSYTYGVWKPARLSSGDINRLRSTWAALEEAKSRTAFGTEIYKAIACRDDNTRKLLGGQNLRLRGETFSEMITETLEVLDQGEDLYDEAVSKLLSPVGVRHKAFYKVRAEHYCSGAAGLEKALKDLLPNIGDPKVIYSWAKLWDIIAYAMDEDFGPRCNGYSAPQIQSLTSPVLSRKVKPFRKNSLGIDPKAGMPFLAVGRSPGRKRMDVTVASTTDMSGKGFNRSMVKVVLRFAEGVEVSFAPGQYVKLRADKADGTWCSAFYSISSCAPIFPASTNELELIVRHIPGGKMSPFLTQSSVKEMEGRTKVVAIAGSFCLPMDANQVRLVFVSGGVGVTPFLSMVRSLVARARKGIMEEANLTYEVIWFLSSRQSSIPCLGELRGYMKEFPLPAGKVGFGLKCVFAVTWPDDDEIESLKAAGVLTHRLEQKHVAEQLKQAGWNAEEGMRIMSCGPTKLMEQARKWSSNLGLPAQHFRAEFFDLK
ncbi:unnamed protein product [Chrysoparadoxa australica]